MKSGKEKKWGILVHLGRNMWGDLHANKKVNFDMECWNNVVDKCVECGMNTIVIDVGEGVQYKTHPELSVEGAWSEEQVKAEVKRLRELGISLIPKLNFSATHDAWLGIYERMISTPEYYKVCRKLIHEVYDMFDQPEAIHIGMDEENWKHVTNDLTKESETSISTVRHNALLVHDINYLAECVKEKGAECHMWHDPFVNMKENYSDDIDRDILPYVWMYYSYLKENWTLISEQSEEVRDFYANEFVRRYGYSIEYVEESPSVLQAISLLEKMFEEKRPFLLTTSNLYIDNCDVDAIEFVRRNNPDFSLLAGMITAPWGAMVPERNELQMNAIELVGKAKKIYEAAVKQS